MHDTDSTFTHEVYALAELGDGDWLVAVSISILCSRKSGFLRLYSVCPLLPPSRGCPLPPFGLSYAADSRGGGRIVFPVKMCPAWCGVFGAFASISQLELVFWDRISVTERCFCRCGNGGLDVDWLLCRARFSKRKGVVRDEEGRIHESVVGRRLWHRVVSSFNQHSALQAVQYLSDYRARTVQGSGNH